MTPDLIHDQMIGMDSATGLDLRSRSNGTPAAPVSPGAKNEIPLHVHSALRNGVSGDEIKELILHARVPRAHSAFAIGQKALAEEGLP